VGYNESWVIDPRHLCMIQGIVAYYPPSSKGAPVSPVTAKLLECVRD